MWLSTRSTRAILNAALEPVAKADTMMRLPFLGRKIKGRKGMTSRRQPAESVSNVITILRSDIERALEDLISNEEGMRFQGLAVILAKQKWPDLIASERKWDLGADAIVTAPAASDALGKVLACSLTATLNEIREDATEIERHFKDVTTLIFATPAKVTKHMEAQWAAEIRKRFGYELVVMPREDIVTSLQDPANSILCRTHLGLHVALEEEVTDLVARVRSAATDVTGTWSTRIKGRPLLQLRAMRLDAEGRDSGDIVVLQDIQTALAQSLRIVLEGAAGRGKTTTLFQLAQNPLQTGGTTFLIDFPAWVSRRVDLLEFIAGMKPFRARSVDAAALARTMEAEHFSFLLNGWNEITESESSQAETALRDLERSFPTAGIIVATRTHHIVPPLPGAIRARLLTITRNERATYLAQRLGAIKAAELQRLLEGDSVLDDLTQTPFIVSEVTSIFAAGEVIPKTKIGVLAAVTRLLEDAPEHRNHLRQWPLSGCAHDYLGEIAMRMTAEGGVTASDAEARSWIISVATRLRNAGQIASLPEPATVLNTLCADHVLERQDYPGISFRFEHQQFQEFYAATTIKRQLWQYLGNCALDAARELTVKYVNEPAWAEPLRMIAESIGGRSPDTSGVNPVEAGELLVVVALSVDPVYAAELAHLCGRSVWQKVRLKFAERLRMLWAAPDKRYRQLAVAAMLASGAEDFQDIVIPILSGEKQQEQLGLYRWGGDFHLSSLGPHWQDVVRPWNEGARARFVSEILHHRHLPEVVSFTIADTSLKVKQAAIRSLSWINAEQDAIRVLQSLSEVDLDTVLQELYPESIPITMRMRAVRAIERAYSRSGDPLARVRLLLKLAQLGETTIADRLKGELDSLSGKLEDQGRYVIRPALDLIRGTDPQWMSDWVAKHVANGSLWHGGWDLLISRVSEELKDSLFQRLETEGPERTQFGGEIAVLAAGADAGLAERTFIKLCGLRRTISASPEQGQEHERAIEGRFRSLLRAMPPSIAFGGVSGFFSHVDTVELEVIAEVFSGREPNGSDLRGQLNPEHREALRAYLRRGVVYAVEHPQSSGNLGGIIASALSVVGEPEDVADLRALIYAEIGRMKKARATRSHGIVSYGLWYLSAAAALGARQADDLFMELLSEPNYERLVSERMVQELAPPRSEADLGRKVDYRKIWDARAGRVRPSGDHDRRMRYAEALRSRIAALSEERAAAEQKGTYEYRLKILATALAAMDSQGSADLVLSILSLPGKWDAWQRAEALDRLLVNGVRLPVEATMKVIEPALEQVRANLYNNQEQWLMARLLCILAFLDKPALGIRKIREVVSSLNFLPYELREVVTAVSHSRCPAALDFLTELAKRAEGVRDLEDVWIDAIAALDTPESRLVLLGFIDPDIPGERLEITPDRQERLASRIADLARRDATIQERLLKLCEQRTSPERRRILAKVMGYLEAPGAILAGLQLIDDSDAEPVPYEIGRQLEAIFVEHRPYRDSPNTYTLAPRSANAIRGKLLVMAAKDERRKMSALGLLSQIEVWRLEHGRPYGEPRHPAIETGVAWPPVDPPALGRAKEQTAGEGPDDLDQALASIKADLVEMRRGAWVALESKRPDSLRQAAHSGRELIDQTLKEGAPDADVRADADFRPDQSSRSGITRRMRLRFMMKRFKGSISETDLAVVEASCDLVEAAGRKLMAHAHGRSAPDSREVKDLLDAAEIALRRLLL